MTFVVCICYGGAVTLAVSSTPAVITLGKQCYLLQDMHVHV